MTIEQDSHLPSCPQKEKWRLTATFEEGPNGDILWQKFDKCQRWHDSIGYARHPCPGFQMHKRPNSVLPIWKVNTDEQWAMAAQASARMQGVPRVFHQTGVCLQDGTIGCVTAFEGATASKYLQWEGKFKKGATKNRKQRNKCRGLTVDRSLPSIWVQLIAALLERKRSEKEKQTATKKRKKLP